MPTLETITKGNNALNVEMKSRGTLSQYRGGKEYTFFLNKTGKQGYMLDVGCAEGFFLKGIEENSSWKAEGVEIIEAAVNFAKQKLNLNVYLGTIDSMTECRSRYDLVRMNNVIEHVLDPVIFLRKTNEVLKIGGLVDCSTPNGVQEGSVLKIANRHGTVLNMLENHLFYYKPATLKAIFKSCGFEIVKAYCDGLKHSIKDLGFIPGARIPDIFSKYNLLDYHDKTNEEMSELESELPEMKNHPSMKIYKLKFNRFINRISKIRIPSVVPVGHQQTIIARKIADLN